MHDNLNRGWGVGSGCDKKSAWHVCIYKNNKDDQKFKK